MRNHKHPWMGLHIPHTRNRDIVKQLPELIRPIEERARGPRDKGPVFIARMYGSKGVWRTWTEAAGPLQNLPRVDFTHIEVRILAWDGK